MEIDLGVVRSNLRRLRQRTGARILGQVKGDAYGHGAVEVARCLEAEGIDWLGVAFVEEAARLRRAGIAAPLLLMAPVLPEQRGLVRSLDLAPTVSSLSQLETWAAFDAVEPIPVHLKFNTGMNRLGIDASQAQLALEKIRASCHLRLAGVLSHFAESEALEGESSARQEECYEGIVARLTAAERQGCLLHLANSAATLHRARSHHDLVRVGGALYGVDLARFRDAAIAPTVEAAMSVHAEIVEIREVAPGAAVGYGGLWTAARPSRIAVLPLGYADGYSSRLSGGGVALVHGRRAAVAGAVSMDYVTLDVTDTGGRIGDEVVLLGRQQSERITVEELARHAGNGPYEVLCRFGLRLRRHYR